MKGYVWYVMTMKDPDGLYANARPIPRCNNLASIFKDRRVVTANACNTKKEAIETANFWNETFIKNGTACKALMPRSEASA